MYSYTDTYEQVFTILKLYIKLKTKINLIKKSIFINYSYMSRTFKSAYEIDQMNNKNTWFILISIIHESSWISSFDI